jgi:HEAT repeat protein
MKTQRTMKFNSPKNATVLATAGAVLTAGAQEKPPAKRAEELISGLKSTNEVDSAAACEKAPEYGASGVRPLGYTMADANFEVARRAKRALYKIVRHVGRPGAAAEAAPVETKLIGLLNKLTAQIRRDVLWMLSEIATARSVAPIAALLTDNELREDARCVLTRLPYPQATAALKSAFDAAPEDFKYALAESLRLKGETMEGYGTKKMIPTKKTEVVAKQQAGR